MNLNLKKEIKEKLKLISLRIEKSQNLDCHNEILKEVENGLDYMIANVDHFIEKEEMENRDSREDVFQHKDNVAWLRAQQL